MPVFLILLLCQNFDSIDDKDYLPVSLRSEPPDISRGSWGSKMQSGLYRLQAENAAHVAKQESKASKSDKYLNSLVGGGFPSSRCD